MIAWAIETLVATSLLMLLVLLVRAPVRRAFGPHIAYALWLLPAARMLLPPLPEGWRSHGVAPLAQASEAWIVQWVEPATVAATIAAPAVPASSDPLPWGLILASAWAIGAVGFLGWHIVSHGRFCASIRRRARATGRVADGRVEVIESDAASGPIAFGVLRKTIAFPRDFADRYDAVERDLALAHELGHHARGDLIANWVALAILALHWFNPLAWRAFRAFRADQEMACDALVLAGRPPSLRQAYGRAIVKSAHGGAVSAACHLHTINELKGRLRMLVHHRRTSRRRLFAGSATGLAVGIAALGLTASGTHAADTIRDRVETTIGVDLAEMRLSSLPLVPQEAPPAPPAPPVAAAPQTVPAPPAPPAKPDANETRAFRTLTIRRPGETTSTTISGFDGEIIERTCGGDDRQHILHEERDGRKVMVLCTDRIQRMAEDAMKRGEQSRTFALSTVRSANSTAMFSLLQARGTIAAQQGLSAEQKAAALAGIDQAIAELQAGRMPAPPARPAPSAPPRD